MNTLYIILKAYDYPHLDSFLLDVRLSGIEIVPYLASDDRLIQDRISINTSDASEAAGSVDEIRGSYLLTDCMQGVMFARETGVGYVFYEPDSVWGPDDAECVILSFDGVDADFIIKMYQRHHKLPWTILTTDRLILREMTVEDVDRLYEIYEEPTITLYTEPLYEDREEEIEYTKAYIRNQYEFFGYGLWIIEERVHTGDTDGEVRHGITTLDSSDEVREVDVRDPAAGTESEGRSSAGTAGIEAAETEKINHSGRIVGRAGLSIREGWDEAELGYVIEKDRQNRGYATEACRAIVKYAKDELGMSGLNCFVRPENIASVRLCERLGFEYLEDAYINDDKMRRYHICLNTAY